jgi:hypothetical protein
MNEDNQYFNKPYFKNNSCDDQFFISQLAYIGILSWLLVYVQIPFLQRDLIHYQRHKEMYISYLYFTNISIPVNIKWDP